MTPQEVCRAAAELLEPEGRWTQDAYARDSRGSSAVERLSPTAVCWCIAGGIDRSIGAIGTVAGLEARKLVARVLNLSAGYGAALWNDTPGRTQAEVVAVLRRAAELDTVEAA